MFLKKGLEAMAARFAGLAALIAPPLITASLILVILVGVHTLARTPEIVPVRTRPLLRSMRNAGQSASVLPLAGSTGRARILDSDHRSRTGQTAANFCHPPTGWGRRSARP